MAEPAVAMDRTSLSAARRRALLPRRAFLTVVGLFCVLGVKELLAPTPEPVAQAAAAPIVDDVSSTGFAEAFARAYLTWDPADPERHAIDLAPFLGPDVDVDAGLPVPVRGRVAAGDVDRGDRATSTPTRAVPWSPSRSRSRESSRLRYLAVPVAAPTTAGWPWPTTRRCVGAPRPAPSSPAATATTIDDADLVDGGAAGAGQLPRRRRRQPARRPRPGRACCRCPRRRSRLDDVVSLQWAGRDRGRVSAVVVAPMRRASPTRCATSSRSPGATAGTWRRSTPHDSKGVLHEGILTVLRRSPRCWRPTAGRAGARAAAGARGLRRRAAPPPTSRTPARTSPPPSRRGPRRCSAASPGSWRIYFLMRARSAPRSGSARWRCSSARSSSRPALMGERLERHRQDDLEVAVRAPASLVGSRAARDPLVSRRLRARAAAVPHRPVAAAAPVRRPRARHRLRRRRAAGRPDRRRAARHRRSLVGARCPRRFAWCSCPSPSPRCCARLRVDGRPAHRFARRAGCATGSGRGRSTPSGASRARGSVHRIDGADGAGRGLDADAATGAAEVRGPADRRPRPARRRAAARPAARAHARPTARRCGGAGR